MSSSSVIEKYKRAPLQFKASIWFLVCSFLQKGISTITTPIFTRLLTSAEYGEYSVFTSWLNILGIFITLSLYQGVYSQGLVKFEEKKEIYSSSMQGLALTLTIAWICIYFLNGEFWNKLFGMDTVQVIAVISLSWTTAVFGFWAAEQRVEYKYVRLVAVTIIVSILKPVTGIILVLNAKDKVNARIIGLAAVEMVVYIWLFFSQMKRGKIFFSKYFWSYALVLAIPLIPHYMSATILNSSDRIMIKGLVNESSAGIYSLAYSISQIMTMLSTSVLQAIGPWISQKIKRKRVEDIGKIAYPALIIIALANVFLIGLAPEIVAIFAPKEYFDAIYVIPPIVMSVFFKFAYDLFASVEFYYEKTSYIAVATFTSAIVNLILNYIFIRIFGYYAAGYTTLFCYILYAFAHYYFMRKICMQKLEGKMAYDLKFILLISIMFLSAGMLFLLIYDNLYLRYGLLMGIIMLMLWKRKNIFAIFREKE